MADYTVKCHTCSYRRTHPTSQQASDDMAQHDAMNPNHSLEIVSPPHST
jgi:hypothetical protein